VRASNKPLVFYSYPLPSPAAQADLAEVGIPLYTSLAGAAGALRALATLGEARRLAQAESQATGPAPDRAGALRALDAAGPVLCEYEAKAVLSAYGIATPPERLARDRTEAIAAAASLGYPVALKIQSPELPHKSDVGGVALGLVGAREATAAAVAMLERVRRARPDAAIDGFTVEPHVERADSLELIVGATSDGEFGPVVLFGEGGKAVEVIADTALELVPLNAALAHALVRRTRVFSRMRGYRDVPPVDVAAVVRSLVRLSQLMVDRPQILAVDVNPLLASARGVVALDARVQLAAGGVARAPLAIRPYPRELEREVALGGRAVTLRPIRPEDEAALQRLFARADDEARARFFHVTAELPHRVAARFTQIDYDRELTLVACTGGRGGAAPELLAVARLASDPERFAARLSALAASPDAAGTDEDAVAHALLGAVVAAARALGLAEIAAELPAGTFASAARALGFAADGARLALRIR
jgi:acetyltransferase